MMSDLTDHCNPKTISPREQSAEQMENESIQTAINSALSLHLYYVTAIQNYSVGSKGELAQTVLWCNV